MGGGFEDCFVGVEYTGPELETYKLRMSFKGTVSRDFLHFFAEKIRPRHMNRQKRFREYIRSQSSIIGCLRSQISSKFSLYTDIFIFLNYC